MKVRHIILVSMLGLAVLATILGYRVHSVRNAATDSSSRPAQSRVEVQQAPEYVPQQPVVGNSEVPGPDVSRGNSEGGIKLEQGSVPALPGIEGYELDAFLPGAKFSVALGAEARDPAWASDMERRLNEALQSRPELRGLSVKLVCRTTACGLLFIASSEDNFDQLVDSVKEFKNWAAGELGFASTGSGSMQLRDGSRFMTVQLSDARSQMQYHPDAIAAMRVAMTIPESGSTQHMGQFPGLSADLGTNATRRMATEQVDPTSSADLLENRIQGEASMIGGASVNRLQVECRVSTCSVVLGFAPGASADLSTMGNRIADAAGLTLESVQRLATSSGDSLAILLKR